MSRRVTVIGIDGRPLTAPALEAIGAAGLVLGAERHLDHVRLAPGCERLTLGAIAPALERLRVTADVPAVVLASGDPGFFGIVRRLRAEGFDLQVLPGLSSIAMAFARLALNSDGAVVATAHGRDVRAAVNVCRAMPLVAVLTGPGAGPGELGAGLIGWNRRLSVLECLGTDQERVIEIDAEDAPGRVWAEPNVVVCRPATTGRSSLARSDNQPAAAPALGWALPESAYAHRDSMITKSEVRALVVARLRPRLGRLIWDVGAGSGSVGIECASLGAAVIAIDDDLHSAELVRSNATRHGVDIRVVTGPAPGVLAGLPDPDAVFIGGGGLAALAAAALRRPARVVMSLVALDRIRPAVEILRGRGFAVEGVQLSASRLSDLPGGSLRLSATNPITVITGELT